MIANPLDPKLLGRRIAEFRQLSCLTQQAVATTLGCSRPTYIAIEKGERRPTAAELVRLAGLLGRPVHELVRPGEPTEGLADQLQTLAKQVSADASALEAALAQWQRAIDDYGDLERLVQAPLRRNYPAEVLSSARVDAAQLASDEAIRERQRLGLGDQPLIDLRSLLEQEVGLRIFYDDLPAYVAGMYAYTAGFGACILVNRKHPPERRRMSLAQEYGHLFIDRYKPSIDYLSSKGRKSAGERFAEAFALCFLMPASSVRRRFHEIVSASGDFQVADLRRLSAFYFVSVEALALRLEQLKMIAKGSWHFLKETQSAPQHAASLEFSPCPANDDPYPDRYQFLAVQAYDRGDLGDSDLAYYLRTDIATAREIAARVRTMREVTLTTGEERQLVLDFSRSLLSDALSADAEV